MRRPRVLAIVLAGGKGERLHPLTRDRSKPAVPFGGKYRIIDFVLSNLVNSDIHSIYVLVQYLSQSLIEHLRASWRIGGRIKTNFITVVPPQMRRGEMWYRGTADAVYQNLNIVRDFRPDLVAVFGSDHVYRMDVGLMIDSHLEREAEVTVAALPVGIEQAHRFGIMSTDPDGRVEAFEEKPKSPRPMPGDPSRAFSSMGNYIFNADCLIQALRQDAKQSGEHDFGRTILPDLCGRARLFAYNFMDNQIPGLKPYEEQGYWRDIGSIRAYWEAHMDLLGPTPLLDLDNREWPILAENYDGPPARILHGEIVDSLVGGGSTISGGIIRRSIVGRGVQIEEGAQVEDSVIIDFCEIGKGARVRRAILDRFNTIKPGEEIGYDPEKDRERFQADPSGIVVLPRGETRFFYKLT